MNVTADQLVAQAARHHDGYIGICAHSEEVVPGDIFIAQGTAIQYAGQAFSHGASICVCDAGEMTANNRIMSKYRDRFFAVENFSQIVDRLVSIIYGDAAGAVTLIGITGTNGKTSTACFLTDLLNALGHRTGYIGTLGMGLAGEELVPTRNTTPDRVSLARYIGQLHAEGCDTVVIEVSSHGIAEDRIRGLEFELGIFTNLHRDHLDFHGSMEAYKQTKFSFFAGTRVQKAVINIDDSAGRQLPDLPGIAGEVFTFSCTGQRASASVVSERSGDSICVEAGSERECAGFYIHGTFQIENVTAAVSACLALGERLADVMRHVPALEAIPGRMSCINVDGKPQVCIDYAHTPDGMQRVLEQTSKESNVVVFGCGGLRDTGKRPLMGQVASEHGRRVVICDDNTRGESGEKIVLDILSGIRNKEGIVICRDRKQAIRYAIRYAGAGDNVYILGKGNEPGSDYGAGYLEGDDYSIATQALEAP